MFSICSNVFAYEALKSESDGELMIQKVTKRLNHYVPVLPRASPPTNSFECKKNKWNAIRDDSQNNIIHRLNLFLIYGRDWTCGGIHNSWPDLWEQTRWAHPIWIAFRVRVSRAGVTRFFFSSILEKSRVCPSICSSICLPRLAPLIVRSLASPYEWYAMPHPVPHIPTVFR